MCGYRRVFLPSPASTTIPPLRFAAIDSRLHDLHCLSLSSAYAKQKLSLEKELKHFLLSLPAQKCLFSAVPWDICRFLTWKDAGGKTQVHQVSCPHLGQHNLFPCGCPRRLSYKTVDSYIGKLRAIFKEAGREGDWDSTLGLGNPAASTLVKTYLKAVTSEQLQACVTPKQASPLFLNKLVLLGRHIERKISVQGISASELYILARDAAFFKTLFFSGDRANDLCFVKTQEILRFPHDDGLLFNHIWGKTLRDGSSNLSGIRRHPNPSLCPVKALETYTPISSELGLDLTNGFLFRPTTPQGHIINSQLTSSAMQSRLRVYLTQAGIDSGETVHSFRSGAAISLALSGGQLADVMSHVGWNTPQTALYYLKLAQVLRPGGPSDLLASDECAVLDASSHYADLNSLQNFLSAFPPMP